MSFTSWLKRKAVQHEAQQYDTPEEARAAVSAELEGSGMSPQTKKTVTWVLGAFLSGAAGSMALSPDALSLPGIKAALAAGVIAGLYALAALFQDKPVNPGRVGDNLVVSVAKAAERGELQEHHVEAIKVAASLGEDR